MHTAQISTVVLTYQIWIKGGARNRAEGGGGEEKISHLAEELPVCPSVHITASVLRK
jgi:hypothetical protein